MPDRALFNYLLSFCPIDLHCEPFNYTIHHLLNMKNAVKRTLIKPCRKVFCKGPVNQANVLCGRWICMYMYVVALYFFLSSTCCHQFYLILSSEPIETPVFRSRCRELILMPSLAMAFVCFVFVLCQNEKKRIGRTRLILIQNPQRRRIDDWKNSLIIEVNEFTPFLLSE